MESIGFIGLGIMGAPMASHLIDGGHQVSLYSRSGAPKALIEKGVGVGVATSAKDAAKSADVIITMVPDTPDVEKVLFGEGGVAEGLSPGRVELGPDNAILQVLADRPPRLSPGT